MGLWSWGSCRCRLRVCWFHWRWSHSPTGMPLGGPCVGAGSLTPAAVPLAWEDLDWGDRVGCSGVGRGAVGAPSPAHSTPARCPPCPAGWATFAVGPGHGVQLASGRLLVPAYTYRVDARECFGRVCRTSPHAFTFYSDDHGRSWHCGAPVPNLRSGECQLAAVGGILYCNARSPLGYRVQALSLDGGASFLPGQLVASLPETARGCQGSILGIPAPQVPGQLLTVQGAPEEEDEEGDRDAFGPERGSTWLLYSHPAGRRARLRMGVCLSRSPLDPHSWTEPWVIYEGPSGYSDLACLGPGPQGTLTFACLFESGARVSYEEISFCLFSLHQVLQGVGPLRGDKPGGHCQPS